jgi:hypothetical protein
VEHASCKCELLPQNSRILPRVKRWDSDVQYLEQGRITACWEGQEINLAFVFATTAPVSPLRTNLQTAIADSRMNRAPEMELITAYAINSAATALLVRSHGLAAF